MIINDRKKAAGIIVSRMGSAKSHVEKPEVTVEPEQSALVAIASEILQAIKDGSPSDLASALQAAMAECEYAESEE